MSNVLSQSHQKMFKPLVKFDFSRISVTRLDYCNSLLHGVQRRTLAKLQRVQNAAARLVARSSPAHPPCSSAVTLVSSGVPCAIQNPDTDIQGLTWKSSFQHQRLATLDQTRQSVAVSVCPYSGNNSYPECEVW